MSSKVLRLVGHEMLSAVLWMCLLNAAHALDLPHAQVVALALVAGAAVGAVLALVGWWMALPMTTSPKWELAARVAVWLALTTGVALVLMLVSVEAGIGLFAAVVATNGVPTVRQVRAVCRSKRTQLPHPRRPQPTHTIPEATR